MYIYLLYVNTFSKVMFMFKELTSKCKFKYPYEVNTLSYPFQCECFNKYSFS